MYPEMWEGLTYTDEKFCNYKLWKSYVSDQTFISKFQNGFQLDFLGKPQGNYFRVEDPNSSKIEIRWPLNS